MARAPKGRPDKLPTAALSGLRWAPPSASPSAWHWKTSRACAAARN